MDSLGSFNQDQFLCDYVGADFEDDHTFDNFFQVLAENVTHFSRQNKTDFNNYFTQFSVDVRKFLRQSLAECFLVHNSLDKTYKLKNKTKDNTILAEIFDLFQLLASINFDSSSYDMNSLFSQITPRVKKTLSPELLAAVNDAVNKAQAPLLKEISELKSKISRLANDLDKLNTANSKNQNSISTPNNVQQNQQKSLFSSVVSNSQNTPNRKRTIAQVNSNDRSLFAKPSSTLQKKLKSFNSFDPNSKSTNADKDHEGFKVAGQKRKNNNKNKVKFIDTLGTGTSTGLAISSKQFYIYLGRISVDANQVQVKAFLQQSFPKVKINNFEELCKENSERSFKSFKFSVDYLDKDIIDQKQLWPRNSVVSKFKLPYAEWLVIAKRIEERKKKIENLTTSSVSSGTTLLAASSNAGSTAANTIAVTNAAATTATATASSNVSFAANYSSVNSNNHLNIVA